MLSARTKAVIEKKLQMPFEAIIKATSEEIDRHIENNVLHKKLNVENSSAEIIQARGAVFPLISKDDINSKIDNYIK